MYVPSAVRKIPWTGDRVGLHHTALFNDRTFLNLEERFGDEQFENLRLMIGNRLNRRFCVLSQANLVDMTGNGGERRFEVGVSLA